MPAFLGGPSPVRASLRRSAPRRLAVATLLSLTVASSPVGTGTAEAATAGSRCSTVDATSSGPGGISLICTRRANKLLWTARTLAPVPEPVTPSPAPVAAPTRNATACVTGSTKGDLFPEKVTITEAKGLQISYADTYKTVKVTNPWRGAKTGFTYVLVQCGTAAPALTGSLAGASIITIPVKAAAIMSTTNAPAFDLLGQADRVIAVDTPAFYSTPSIVARIAEKKIVGTGGGSRANIEQLVALKPDVVITYGSGAAAFDGIDKLADAKLPALVEAGYMEETPLGRAEWVKLIAALTNTEAKAEAEFQRWSADYRALAERALRTKNKPVVISGSMYQGTWYMPGGKSFAAQYIRDAGGSYPWSSDTTTGSLPLDFEAVFEKAYDASFWINAGYLWNTPADALAEDSRYARLLPFRTGRTWGNDRRVNAGGGSDYFETAVVRPDLVLADLVSVLHPDLVPGHTPIWYRKIGR